MQYFSRLGLEKEPFSNSPDPNFLYLSSQHVECLQQLEISVRLKRGLNVVIGQVGTGKTTLLRQLIRQLGADKNIQVHLLLDPEFPSARAFLKLVCTQLCGRRPDPGLSEWGIKERIKKELFRLGVKQGKVVVLIIDEGQKISADCLEILRELLNFETNSAKLLQIVLFAQEELEPIMAKMHNFVDRINCRLRLGPLSRAETGKMVEFRIDRAMPSGEPLRKLFTEGAVRQIYRATNGYPRKVIRLCHKAVLAMLVAGSSRVNAGMVQECLRQEGQRKGLPMRWAVAAAVLALVVVAVGVVLYASHTGQSFKGLTQAVAATESGSMIDGAPGLLGLALAMAMGQKVTRPTSAVFPGWMSGTMTGHAPDLVGSASLVGLPDSLGTIRLLPQEDIAEVIRAVYGVYDAWHLKVVASANKQLGDLEQVPAGTPLVLPARADLAGCIPDWAWWISLDAAPELEKAYVMVRKYRYFGLSTRVLPVWSDRDGLAFRVVLTSPYTRPEAAQADLKGLPLALQAGAELWRVGSSGEVVLGSMSPADREVLGMPASDLSLEGASAS